MTIKQWLHERLPSSLIFGERFYVPKNLNFWYVFGALLLFALVMQFISGLWLVMFYQPSATDAFASVERIIREVRFGWLIHDIHTIGASALFILLYLHMLRGLLYRSYRAPREMVWVLGVVLFWLMMAEAFLGYLLPWGQMSYWGATVITNLLSVFPHGDQLAAWVRGDYQVSGMTLTRFYALHIVAIPMLLIWVIQLHARSLHHVGSGNPALLPIDTRYPNPDCQAFFPFQALKDVIAIIIFLIIFCSVLFFMPHGFGYLNEPLNHVPADPMQTPADIKPLWYMSAFYAILRAVPNKVGGIMLLVTSLVSWLFIPWLDRVAQRCPLWLHRSLIVLFVCCSIALTILGLQPITAIFAPLLLALSFAYIGLLLLSVVF